MSLLFERARVYHLVVKQHTLWTQADDCPERFLHVWRDIQRHDGLSTRTYTLVDRRMSSYAKIELWRWAQHVFLWWAWS